MTWRRTRVAAEGTHHVLDGAPLYAARFDAVLAFHEPGLAPVRRGDEAWHARDDGSPAYGQRFHRTFGFYEGLATVIDESGWSHIRPDGLELAPTRYAWAGNFQDRRCTVRSEDGGYHHVDEGGEFVYAERWRYAGDFRDGISVVQRDDGLSSHIHRDGRLVHDRWFLDLDVFHKGLARARDARGWTHVDRWGRASYEQRFAMVEPYYNGQARVEGRGGELLVIDESGQTRCELRPARESPLQRLSGQMVGFWKTQTIRTAVEFGVLDALPASTDECAAAVSLSAPLVARLLRGLWELDLVERRASTWHPTETGQLLRRRDRGSAADAALLWGREHYTAWGIAPQALREGRCAHEIAFGDAFFERLSRSPEDRDAYDGAMRVYAQHDYAGISVFLPLDGVQHVIDAGGGSGVLVMSLLTEHASLRGTLLDRPEVVECVHVAVDVAPRLDIVAGDLFAEWPCDGDLIVLARVLHDWDDDAAVQILERARAALLPGGRIAVVEMVLTEDDPNGALLDLNMLLMCGSQERTRDGWERLARTASLCVTSITRLPTYGNVLVLEVRHVVEG